MSYLDDFRGPCFTSAGPVNLEDLNRLGNAVMKLGRSFVYIPPVPRKRRPDDSRVDA